MISRALTHVPSKVDGIVITGGCAMNVKANDAVRLRFKMPAFVPSAPGDAGLPVGAAWLFTPPSRRPGMALAYGGADGAPRCAASRPVGHFSKAEHPNCAAVHF